ncbi:MAG: nucleotidyltransferase domain-containing protein [Candidatus Woesearchaeota archaeon]
MEIKDPILRQILNRAKKDPSVLAIALFGSYARQEKNYRDIDICLFLVPGKYSQLQLSKQKLKYTPEEEKYDVQIFQQLPLYIQKRILKEGKIIYCQDENKLYDLYYRSIQDYELFRPYYEDYLKAVENG